MNKNCPPKEKIQAAAKEFNLIAVALHKGGIYDMARVHLLVASVLYWAGGHPKAVRRGDFGSVVEQLLSITSKYRVGELTGDALNDAMDDFVNRLGWGVPDTTSVPARCTKCGATDLVMEVDFEAFMAELEKDAEQRGGAIIRASAEEVGRMFDGCGVEELRSGIFRVDASKLPADDPLKLKLAATRKVH